MAGRGSDSTGSGASRMSSPSSVSHAKSDAPFYTVLGVLGGGYVLLIVAMVAAEIGYARVADFSRIFADENIRFAIRLSVISASISTILALWVSVPIAYLMSRSDFRGKQLVDAIIDIPIVLPPLVVGLCLLILFRQTPLRLLDDRWPIAFHIPAVILAQFAVVTAFAVRTLRATFDEISPRQEQVALTLGCRRTQAFWFVVLPEARYGLLSAATLAWARALGEFGPVLVFAGATRQRTEGLSTTVFLELSVGKLESAVAVSLLMVIAAIVVLLLVRELGSEKGRQS